MLVVALVLADLMLWLLGIYHSIQTVRNREPGVSLSIGWPRDALLSDKGRLHRHRAGRAYACALLLFLALLVLFLSLPPMH